MKDFKWCELYFYLRNIDSRVDRGKQKNDTGRTYKRHEENRENLDAGSEINFL